MGTTAARKLRTVIANSMKVLAIEYLAAAQAIEFGKGKLGIGTEKAYAKLREVIPPLSEDREMHVDMAKAAELLASGCLVPEI